MTDRILDIAENPAYLSVRNGLLCLRSEPQGQSPAAEITIPLAELAAVVLTHPQITCTRTVLSGLAEAGAVVVACNDHFLPVAMMLPIAGYHAPARRLAAQAAASLPIRKRLWQQIVVAKIQAQAAALADLQGDDAGLGVLARRVRSGDRENAEAQAARRYWLALFADPRFLRDPEAPDQNRFLNYGYAVLRAAVARAICASGLHPGLGLHHHHRNNAFCLADDLMEPFRPLVDRAVALLLKSGVAAGDPLDKRVKPALIEPILGRYRVADEDRTLPDILGRLTASLAAVFEGVGDRLVLPMVALKPDRL